MNTIEAVVFFIVCITIMLRHGIAFYKRRKTFEKEKRRALEAENTEYDYGHNVKYNSEEI